ncbi:MAG: TOBE domain-containing protein, partial [Gemmatimonadales bacterium]
PGILLPAASGGPRVRIGAVEWRLSGGGDRRGWLAAGGAVLVMVRPEALRFVTPSPEVLTGEVLHRRFAGATAFFTVAIAEGTNLEISAAPAAARVGDTVGLAPLADPADLDGTIHLFPPGAG